GRFADIEDEFADVLADEDDDRGITPKEATATRVSKRRIVINGRTYKADPSKDKNLGKKVRKFEKTLLKSTDNGAPISNKTNLYKAVKNHPL
ncbi:hypothetical protein ACP3WV_22745, partial [Salmonella enterica]|uniref:hypothetical protein n=1 Tax=Salmonella enterica TaxID=28901 RepID=UPI003CF45371